MPTWANPFTLRNYWEEVHLRYVASARLDELLTVSVQVVEQGQA